MTFIYRTYCSWGLLIPPSAAGAIVLDSESSLKAESQSTSLRDDYIQAAAWSPVLYLFSYFV